MAICSAAWSVMRWAFSTARRITTARRPTRRFRDDKAFAGRLFSQPWKNSDVNALHGLGFGVGGSYQANHPQRIPSTGLTPGYTTDGQQKFFTYNSGVNANGALAAFAAGLLLLRAVQLAGRICHFRPASRVRHAKSADLQNTAWEISGGWVLTGEDAPTTA